ncbi:MAG: SoxR reducing system RseC family protein [Chloroflexota bacterium]
MQELGIVAAVHGSVADVRITRTTACATCGKCHGFDENQQLIIKARNAVGATTGDAVRLEMEGVSVLKAASVVYGLPLLAAMVGFFIGSAIHLPGGRDLTGWLGATGFVLALVVVWLYDRRLKASGKGQPVIVEVFGAGQSNDGDRH